MDRRIIQIDEESCNGCGLCITACEEGALGLVNGKARLLREDYCDGLGNCLPACPQDAIHFSVRDAEPFMPHETAQYREPRHIARGAANEPHRHEDKRAAEHEAREERKTKKQWPIQLQLVPPGAPFLEDADILLSADCAPFARDTFQEDFMTGKALLIACPKLDSADYVKSLTDILSTNNIRSVTISRMEVPCCGGLEYALSKALEASGKNIPVEVVTITSQGEIKSRAKS